MSDEQTTDRPAQASSPTPTPPASGGGTTAPERVQGLDVNARVKVGGKEMALSEVMELAAKATGVETELNTLKENWASVTQMIRADSSPEMRNEATRKVLLAQGYAPDQVDQYLQARAQAGQASVDDDEGDAGDEDPQTEPNVDRVARDELGRMRAAELKREIQSQVARMVDGDTDVAKLVAKVREARGEEQAEKARARLSQDMYNEIVGRLTQKRNRVGSFSDTWISEEAPGAAKEVFGRYQSVIGDVDAIGRSSTETGTGESFNFTSEKPVNEPQYKPGMSLDSIEGSLESWTRDQLERAAADLALGSSRA